MDFSHITIKVNDLSKSIEFYSKFGFNVLFKMDDQALIQNENVNILLRMFGENEISFYDENYVEKEVYNDPSGTKIEFSNKRIQKYNYPPTIAAKLIKADLKKVWDTFVNPNGWDEWFTNGMTMVLKEEGKMKIRWFDQTYGEEVLDEGIIHTLIEHNKIVFSWNKYGDIYKSMVTMRFFEAQIGGTWIYVEDENLVTNEEEFKIKLDCAVGWGEMLTLAKFWIEKGISIFK
ncbi:hypothetical protein OSSY52_11640 [Tepiditoga spiralis]|uniref:VOC domain-containing protein n=1 Tax=Tepiditoga spiralis TaxID=2108365 RepID=A0A7G1G7Z7_9BACT|nr:SRPBCC domain-containing protein [Tepiditoga spiralis]BBE31023.1 hypothetical protein OSSY52_11640 [Tepiditoga spiralis]